MSSLADKRRASGARAEAERRASDPAAARRQSGRDMVERRTGKSEADDLNSLITPPRQRRSLPVLDSRGAQPAQRGRGVYTPPPAGTGGGGIASPLTAVSRTFSETDVYVETVDGSGLFRVRKIDTLTMTDADGREVVINGLAFEPPEETP